MRHALNSFIERAAACHLRGIERPGLPGKAFLLGKEAGIRNPGRRGHTAGARPTSTLGRRRTNAGGMGKSCALHEDVWAKRLAWDAELLFEFDSSLGGDRSRTIRP